MAVCATISVDVAKWLLEQTPLKKLPEKAQDYITDSFPAGKAQGKLCLVAQSQSENCKKRETAEASQCCKFTQTPHLVVRDIPDTIKFSTPGAAGIPAASVDIKLSGDNTNNNIHWDHRCAPPHCAADRAYAEPILRVDGTLTLAGTTFAVGVSLTLKGPKGADLEDLKITCKPF